MEFKSNIPTSIGNKLGVNLHRKHNHPISLVKHRIYEYFDTTKYSFDKFDELSPIVSIEDNFDRLLIPKDHPARSKSDTYYVDNNRVLRTHTSAHQHELLSRGHTHFLVTGDVYRKDEIDRNHYPVFHQMEGVCLLDTDVDAQKELLDMLIGLVKTIFPGSEYRINSDYFPFTDPSYEIEVKYGEQWLEILGCGVMQPQILINAGIVNKKGIAWGMGLERICLKLCNIPDIRYLWTTDDKFLTQWSDGKLNTFKTYSLLDNIYRDISFWVEDIYNDKWIRENDFYEIIRNIASDMVQEVKNIDTFYHHKKMRHSLTYRITYSPSDTSMNNPSDFRNIINTLHNSIIVSLSEHMTLEFR